MGKRCFVTIGATASFNKLLAAVLQPAFLDALRAAHYTELRIQYGKEGQTIFEKLKNALPLDQGDQSIEITGFDFKTAGLRDEMVAVKGGDVSTEGMVISHAGSGSILDALRVGVPLAVVPNPDLLHNHQVELAEILAEQRYVVHGQLNDLVPAIAEAENLRRHMKRWPPVQGGDQKYELGLAGVMDEEMGWLD